MNFSNLNLIGEAFHKILIYYTIRGSKEGEDMGNEVTSIVIESVVPILRENPSIWQSSWNNVLWQLEPHWRGVPQASHLLYYQRQQRR